RPRRPRLRHHVLPEDLVDLLRRRQRLQLEAGRDRQLLVDDLVAEIDALVADVDAGPGDQLLDLTLRLAAEAAEQLLVGVGWTCQLSPLSRRLPGRTDQVTTTRVSACHLPVTRREPRSLQPRVDLQSAGRDTFPAGRRRRAREAQ